MWATPRLLLSRMMWVAVLVVVMLVMDLALPRRVIVTGEVLGALTGLWFMGLAWRRRDMREEFDAARQVVRAPRERQHRSGAQHGVGTQPRN